MPLEDPFFVVREEVTKALYKVRALVQRRDELNAGTLLVANPKNETEWTTNQLKTALRSIEWDLEDLEDTIAIVEKNPSKFRLDNSEVLSRRNFISSTKSEVKSIKEKIRYSRDLDTDYTVKQPQKTVQTTLSTSHPRPKDITGYSRSRSEIMTIEGSRMRSDGYFKLSTEPDSPSYEHSPSFAMPVVQQQQTFVNRQDNTIELISGSVKTLRGMATTIASELDDQALMLEDMGQEIESADSRVNATLKKMAHVMRMSSDRRQWTAIGALSGVLAILLFLFFIL